MEDGCWDKCIYLDERMETREEGSKEKRREGAIYMQEMRPSEEDQEQERIHFFTRGDLVCCTTVALSRDRGSITVQHADYMEAPKRLCVPVVVPMRKELHVNALFWSCGEALQ